MSNINLSLKNIDLENNEHIQNSKTEGDNIPVLQHFPRHESRERSCDDDNFSFLLVNENISSSCGGPKRVFNPQWSAICTIDTSITMEIKKEMIILSIMSRLSQFL
jgi:hypothetical protein